MHMGIHKVGKILLHVNKEAKWYLITCTVRPKKSCDTVHLKRACTNLVLGRALLPFNPSRNEKAVFDASCTPTL